MHIILGFLGTIVTILVLLNRLAENGIDLGGLNPFLWHRRRKWRNLYQGNPIFKIENPMDATAILMVAAAKADGDLAREDKNQLLELFEKHFNLSRKDAAGLLISSAHLLGDGSALRSNLKRFIAPSRGGFNAPRIRAALDLIGEVVHRSGNPHPNALDLLQQVSAELGSNSVDTIQDDTASRRRSR